MRLSGKKFRRALAAICTRQFSVLEIVSYGDDLILPRLSANFELNEYSSASILLSRIVSESVIRFISRMGVEKLLRKWVVVVRTVSCVGVLFLEERWGNGFNVKGQGCIEIISYSKDGVIIVQH